MKSFMFVTLLLFVSSCLYSQDGNYAHANGVKLYYETHGEGTSLLLLHPFARSHEAWDPWIDQLSEHYHVIVPDLRGHGRSTNPSQKYTHHKAARDLLSLMNQLEITEVKAIGAGAGGLALMKAARMEPSRINCMIIAAPGFFNAPESKVPTSFESASKEWLNHMTANHARGDDQIKTLIRQYNSFEMPYKSGYLKPGDLSRIQCPTLIIHDDQKRFKTEKSFTTPSSFGGGSCRQITSNVSHTPLYGELTPDKLINVSESFLGD